MPVYRMPGAGCATYVAITVDGCDPALLIHLVAGTFGAHVRPGQRNGQTKWRKGAGDSITKNWAHTAK